MSDERYQVPTEGEKITIQDGSLKVPDHPILPFIEGDGIGPDIWRAAVRVFDAAVEKAYDGSRKIAWMEVYAGQKALISSVSGCLRRPIKPSVNFWWGSKDL